MRVLIITAAAMALSGCSSMGGGQSQTDFLDAVKQIASDPRCGHVDRVQGDIGGLSSGLHVFLERTCPAQPATPASQ